MVNFHKFTYNAFIILWRSLENLLINESIKYKFSLGEDHVAYRRSDFPLIKVSVVGGRPFSSGGKALSPKKLLSARYVL